MTRIDYCNLKNFLEDYYLDFSLELIGNNCTLKNSKGVLLKEVPLEKIKEYMEKNLYFHPIFIFYNKNDVFSYFLNNLRYYTVWGYDKETEHYQFYIKDEDNDLIVETFETLEERNEWIVNTLNFSIEKLNKYICPKCERTFLDKSYIHNAIIHSCNCCGTRTVEVL